jgi:phage shock protein A
MFKVFKRWWKYLTARASSKFEESADPKTQLEQAIQEAQDQHRRLTEQAANVIAHQKQTQMRLDRANEELEKVTANARQALLLTDEATTKGDTAKALEYQRAAESFANRLIALEREVEGLKNMLLDATQNADAAKGAVQKNSMALQKKLSERQRLLSQLDQAKMQERMNKAMASLTATVGEDVPTFEQVREKIEARAAKAQGMGELQGTSVEARMIDVEQAQLDAEAAARLSQLRTQLGLPAPVAETPAVEAPAVVEQPAQQPATGTGTGTGGESAS